MGGSSGDEGMDDGLHIKPPQHHHRHKDKDRKRDRGHRERRQDRDHQHHQHRHHRGDEGGGGKEGKDRSRGHRETSASARDREREYRLAELERLERKEREKAMLKHRSSGGSSRKHDDRDTLLLEQEERVKKERRNMEFENERAFREIEKRRAKEKGPEEFGDYERERERYQHGSSGRSSNKRERDLRERLEQRHREREWKSSSNAPDDERERGVKVSRKREREEDDHRLKLEVQDVEESNSELEEGERSPSRSSNSKDGPDGQVRVGDASDKSDVSSASEHDEEAEKKQEKAASDVDNSSGSARKSHSDGRSDVSSSSSSSSSDSESEQDRQNDKNGGDGPKPPKISKREPKEESKPPSPDEIDVEAENPDIIAPDSANPANEDSKDVPTIVITQDEEEEDLIPRYNPAVQGCRRVEEFQLLNRIEEGTYGVVYRAKEKRTDEVVALKRLKMEKEKDGFPITSLREINTLLKAQHENIVTVREIVVGSNTDKIFLVMDYVEHDLKALMETLKQKGQVFLIEEVKCLMIQLLRAVAHMHDNWILHRDLKTSNLLLSHKGILKVGDFGLAREYGSPLKAYTPIVVTLWYRAPELLLGTKEYSTPIDNWSLGCIFGELLKMEPMFPGKSEANQLNLIFQSLGTPNDRIWPGYSKLPLLQKMTFADYPVNKLKTRFGHLTDLGIDLMNKFLTFNPVKRITAEEALKHSFFREMPLPIDPSMFPTWPAKSELGHRKAAASPKPPSGGHQYKEMDEKDAVGFFLGGGDARRQPIGAGFSLKF